MKIKHLIFTIFILNLLGCVTTEGDLLRDDFYTSYCFTSGFIYGKKYDPDLPADLSAILQFDARASRHNAYLYTVTYTENDQTIEKLFYGNLVFEDGRNDFSYFGMYTGGVFSVIRQVYIIDGIVVSDEESSLKRTLHNISQNGSRLDFLKASINHMGDFSLIRPFPIPAYLIPEQNDINAQGILPFLEELDFKYNEKLSNHGI